MALATLTDLEAYLGDIDDTLGNNLLSRASAIISSYCGRTFESTTYTNQVLDGKGTNSISLPEYPVITFTQLQRRTSTINEDDWETIDSSSYFVNTDSGVIRYALSTTFFAEQPQHYRATYTAGYATIPEDLEQACLALAVDLYNNMKKSGGVQSESIGDYSITYDTNADTFKTLGLDLILEKYKKPRL